MHSLVIADTSCLIVLQKIDRLDVLEEIFDKINITQEIADEFGNELPSWITITSVKDKMRERILELDLDKREASAIALGLENNESLILIDEKKGRKKAMELGLKIMGTLGVLIIAKEMNIVNSMMDEIEKLKQVNFRMSEKLISEILKRHE